MEGYGALSVLPPALSIILAVYTRNIIFSLTLGAYSGALIIADFNPFLAFAELLEKHAFVQISTPSNTQVLIVMLAIGGFIQMLDKSGGSRAFASVMVKFIGDPLRAQLAAWTTGLSVFFTDSGNALIVGPLFKPVFRELKICREKLAYIIDTTASPVTILIPFIGWGVYIMSLIENAYRDVGLAGEPYQVLLSVWPYQFYAFLALISIPMILSTGKDFGPMAKAQRQYNKAVAEGLLDEELDDPDPANKEQYKLITVILPLSVMLITMVTYMGYFAYLDGIKSLHMRAGICLSYTFASIACAYLMKKHKKTTYNDSLNIFVRGMQKLVFICFVLVLAWTLSSLCRDLHTGDYLATLIGDRISPNFFPLIVFFLGAIMSFATGSSYGTFAILMIIVVPIANTLGAPMILTIAAVLSGGLFGDHTSPISDTTVLASMGAGCPHIDHVSTQFAYASLNGAMAMLAFIVAGFYQSPAIIFFIIVIQYITIRMVMKFYGHDSRGE
ncbi:MAG: L-lactate permease [Alphaproteobacteria bacterium]|nr:L-lactate permease [Alphaproteobacteria bacterium]HPF45440.1 Na+/H+ antiporter NhaC family protein [Emcibacteraceae bacterium]HRW29193.1 Na+/H+ antiporter NhaC family protein [Emcibacteraceae bacterium]